jgi:hypothetical protein
VADDCPNCANLMAAVARLTGGITGTIALIRAQDDEPTMPRYQLPTVIEGRLQAVLDTAH